MLVIPLATDFLQKVLDREKTSTIRFGKRPYPIGLGVLKAGNKTISIEIENTRFCSASDLTDRDAQKDGFADLEELNQQLKRFYPEITPADLVTVVDFRVKE